MVLRRGTVVTLGGGGFSMPEVADGPGIDDHVLRLVERRLEEETERRSWRRGSEVF